MRFLFLVCLLISVSASAEKALIISECKLSPAFDNIITHLKNYKKQYIKLCENKKNSEKHCLEEFDNVLTEKEEEKQRALQSFISTQGHLFSHTLKFEDSGYFNSWEINAPPGWHESGKNPILYKRPTWPSSGNYGMNPEWGAESCDRFIDKPHLGYPDYPYDDPYSYRYLYSYSVCSFGSGVGASHELYNLRRFQDEKYNFITNDLPVDIEIKIYYYIKTGARIAHVEYNGGQTDSPYYLAVCKVEGNYKYEGDQFKHSN
jgi:hypothetical protein